MVAKLSLLAAVVLVPAGGLHLRTSKQDLPETKVDQVVSLWTAVAQGKLSGPGSNCAGEVGNYFQSDAVIDFRAPAKDARYFKKYDNGFDGVCEYFNNREAYTINDVKSTQYKRGDDIILILDYSPGKLAAKDASGIRASGRMLQVNVMKLGVEKCTGFESFFSDPTLYDELSEGGSAGSLDPGPQGALVASVFSAYEEGMFAGDACKDSVQTMFTPDAVIDFRGPSRQTDIFKRYSSFDGVCEYFKNIQNIVMTGLPPEPRMYSRGDDVVHILEYTPGMNGKEASEKILQINVIKFNSEKSKITGFETFFSEPLRFDELVPSASAVPALPPSKADAVVQVFTEYAQGKYSGEQCAENAGVRFTPEAVIDIRGPVKDGAYFKKYSSGLAGVCEYFEKSAEYTMNDMEASSYKRGDDLVHVMSYVPGLPGHEGHRASARLLQLDVIKFDSDLKFKELDAIFDKPCIYDGLGPGEKPETEDTPQMDVVVSVFTNFANGDYSGKSCVDNVKSLFMDDAVIDFRGPTGRPDIFKKYNAGFEGVCEFFQNSAEIAMWELSPNLYARGDDCVHILDYIPGLSSTGVQASQRIKQFNVIRFNAEKTKFAGMEVFFDKPSIYNEIMPPVVEEKAEEKPKPVEEAPCSD